MNVNNTKQSNSKNVGNLAGEANGSALRVVERNHFVVFNIYFISALKLLIDSTQSLTNLEFSYICDFVLRLSCVLIMLFSPLK